MRKASWWWAAGLFGVACASGVIGAEAFAEDAMCNGCDPRNATQIETVPANVSVMEEEPRWPGEHMGTRLTDADWPGSHMGTSIESQWPGAHWGS